MKELVVVGSITSMIFWLVSCVHITSQASAPPPPTPLPRFTWDTARDVRVVLATYCCDSPITEELVRFYIPEAQLWGDGRFLWITRDAEGARHVSVTRLTTDEMQALVQAIASAGFFEWEEEYAGEPLVDGTSKCLTVTLVDRNNTVCETHGGAPIAFYTLFDRLSQGAGYSGIAFHPDRAFVTGFQLEELVAPRPEPELTWRETQIHLPITRALSGFWLEEGETLRVLWEAANHDPYHMPIVEDGDSLYRLILQIPGASWIEP
jgi:hypothetical protein